MWVKCRFLRLFLENICEDDCRPPVTSKAYPNISIIRWFWKFGNAPLHRWQRFVVGSNYGHRKGGALTDDTPPESSAEAS